jgi:hypothetical protein
MHFHHIPARRLLNQLPIWFICLFIVWCNMLEAAEPVSHDRQSVSRAMKQDNYPFSIGSAVKQLSSKSESSNETSLIGDTWDDLGYILREPDFYMIVGGLGLTPEMFRSAFRNESPEFSEMWGSSKFADQFFEWGSGLGSFPYHFGTALFTYFTGKVSHNESLEKFGSDLFRAQMINGLATISLKAMVYRRRPDGGPFSFPSGHTSTAFTTATVIYHDLGKVWGSAAYLGAAYVGFSRLQENRHYLSDVVGGAILGTYLSFKVMHRKEKETRINISPILGKNYRGFNLQMHF